jgi:hypothetical protein
MAMSSASAGLSNETLDAETGRLQLISARGGWRTKP